SLLVGEAIRVFADAIHQADPAGRPLAPSTSAFEGHAPFNLFAEGGEQRAGGLFIDRTRRGRRGPGQERLQIVRIETPYEGDADEAHRSSPRGSCRASRERRYPALMVTQFDGAVAIS